MQSKVLVFICYRQAAFKNETCFVLVFVYEKDDFFYFDNVGVTSVFI